MNGNAIGQMAMANASLIFLGMEVSAKKLSTKVTGRTAFHTDPGSFFTQIKPFPIVSLNEEFRKVSYLRKTMKIFILRL